MQLGVHGPAEPSRIALREWIEVWWGRGEMHWARSTRLHRAAIFDKWIAPHLGGVRLSDLGAARVREWQAAIRREGCSAKQTNQTLRVLSAILGAAVDDDLIPTNPCARVKRFSTAKPRPRVMQVAEVERIRSEVPSARDRAMVGLLAYAGLRPEEALALRWADVGSVLVIDRAFTHGEEKATKTYSRRTVEVVSALREDLEELRAAVRPAASDLVCPSMTGGHLSLTNWRARVWKPAAAQAGVDANPYDGRHTYASLLIHEGRSPLAVAAALGHSSAETTWKHYVHIFEGARHDKAVPMEEAIARARVRPVCVAEPRRHLRLVS